MQQRRFTDPHTFPTPTHRASLARNGLGTALARPGRPLVRWLRAAASRRGSGACHRSCEEPRLPAPTPPPEPWAPARHWYVGGTVTQRGWAIDLHAFGRRPEVWPGTNFKARKPAGCPCVRCRGQTRNSRNPRQQPLARPTNHKTTIPHSSAPAWARGGGTTPASAATATLCRTTAGSRTTRAARAATPGGGGAARRTSSSTPRGGRRCHQEVPRRPRCRTATRRCVPVL